MAAESADGDDTDDDLGDWVTLSTEEGQTYYYNPRSEESRWERPTMGWSEYQDDWGRTYFHNSATGESAWELPAEATHGPVQVQSAGADAGAGEASPRHDTAATASSATVYHCKNAFCKKDQDLALCPFRYTNSGLLWLNTSRFRSRSHIGTDFFC